MKLEKTNSVFEITFRFLFLILLVTGLLYPLFIQGIGNFLDAKKISGSVLLSTDGKVLGSELLALPISENGFQGRQSSSAFSYLPSNASQLAPSSKELLEISLMRLKDLEKKGISVSDCRELLFSSASGLDPHISYQCALSQISYVSSKTNMEPERLRLEIEKNRTKPFLKFLGSDRVNVTTLNLAIQKIIETTESE